MKTSNLKSPTPYKEINQMLSDLTQEILNIFDNKLVGLYLFGSLSYGDFNPKSSDIDLVAIINKTTSKIEIEKINKTHIKLAKKYPKWAKRVEISYTPLEMLSEIYPPKLPRIYYGEGILYPKAQYGHEWIINNFLLEKFSISLFGPEFKTLLKPINIIDVQKACIKDLFKEWEPKIFNSQWLENNHCQSYLILNLCRILYTVLNSSVGSKKVSANWVKITFPQWKNLIEKALKWQYGIEMNRKKETIEFIKFTISEIDKTNFLTKKAKDFSLASKN